MIRLVQIQTNISNEKSMRHAQTFWVSGGSKGIGRALVEKLLANGKTVAFSARGEDEMHDLIRAQPAERQHKAIPVVMDVATNKAVTEAYQQVKDKLGVPDCIIANAGTHKGMRADDINFADCNRIINVNLLGSIRMITEVLPDMLERGSGHIVGVASLSGYRGLPTAACYGASKAGLQNFLQSLRFDVQHRGLHVTEVNPGFVDTPLTRQNSFDMPDLISTDKAAEYIYNGVQSRAYEVHFPPKFSWQLKLLGLLPYPLYHRIMKAITRPDKETEL